MTTAFGSGRLGLILVEQQNNTTENEDKQTQLADAPAIAMRESNASIASEAAPLTQNCFFDPLCTGECLQRRPETRA